MIFDYVEIVYDSVSKKVPLRVLFFLVRLKGLEPPRRRHQILSLARLPIPPQPRSNIKFCKVEAAAPARQLET